MGKIVGRFRHFDGKLVGNVIVPSAEDKAEQKRLEQKDLQKNKEKAHEDNKKRFEYEEGDLEVVEEPAVVLDRKTIHVHIHK